MHRALRFPQLPAAPRAGLDRAESVLLFALTAAAVPTLLLRLVGEVAASLGPDAAVLFPFLAASGTLVRGVGAAVLIGVGLAALGGARQYALGRPGSTAPPARWLLACMHAGAAGVAAVGLALLA